VNETVLSVEKFREATSELCPRLRFGEQGYTEGTIFHLPAASGSDYRFFLEVGSFPMVKAYRNRSFVGRITESYSAGLKFHEDEIWSWPFDVNMYDEMDCEKYVETATKYFLEFVHDISVYETCIAIKKHWLWPSSRQCQALMKEGWTTLPRFSQRKETQSAANAKNRPVPHSACKNVYRSPPLSSR